MTDSPADWLDSPSIDKAAVWLPKLAVDFFNAGRPAIDGKTFTDCLIEGPAVLFAMDNVVFDDCNMGVAADPKNLLMQPLGTRVVGAVAFTNTRFVRCRFALISFTGHDEFMDQFEQVLNANRLSQAAS